MSPELTTRIKTYYDQSSDEQEIILRQVLAFANEFPAEVVKLIHQQPFEYGMNDLAVFYTALANDAGKWSEFFLAEAERILQAANTSNNPSVILQNLNEFAFLDSPAFKQREKLITLFKSELSDEKAVFRYYAVRVLGDLVRNTDVVTLSAIEQRQKDPNWRVRYLAYLNILDFLLTHSRAVISIIDRIRAHFLNFTDIK